MPFEYMTPLLRDSENKIVLLVLDGLGGLPIEPGGLTELETAQTPVAARLGAADQDGDRWQGDRVGRLQPALPAPHRNSRAERERGLAPRSLSAPMRPLDLGPPPAGLLFWPVQRLCHVPDKLG